MQSTTEHTPDVDGTELETPTFADELRILTDFLDAHPAAVPRYQCIRMDHFVDTLDEATAVRRAVGGQWTKHEMGSFFVLRRRITPHTTIEVTLAREQACERVQVGTETVMVPAEDAPMVEVEQPVYEWKCPESLLAGAEA